MSESRTTVFLFAAGLGILPAVPALGDPRSLLFLAAFAIFQCWLLIRSRGVLQWDTQSTLAAIILFVVLPINFLVAILDGRGIGELMRAAIPFLFIASYFTARTLAAQNRLVAQNIILLAACIWAIMIAALNFPTLIDVLRGNIARLTYSVPEMLIPFGMVGFILLLYMDIPKHWRIFLVGLFLILIVASGYRSQIGLAVLAVIFRYRNMMSVKDVSMAVVAALAATVFIMVNDHYIAFILKRFAESGGDSVREAERAYAFARFFEKPLFGHGLGHEVPINVTRDPRSWKNFEVDSVPYIHNFLAYLLMNFGVFGTVFFMAFLSTALFQGALHIWVYRNTMIEGITLTLICLLVYMQISASFRQIQMWIVICLLCSVIAAARAPRGHHA